MLDFRIQLVENFPSDPQLNLLLDTICHVDISDKALDTQLDVEDVWHSGTDIRQPPRRLCLCRSS